MENLYQVLKEKEEYLKSFQDNPIKYEYIEEFLKGFVPCLVEDTISNLSLDNIRFFKDKKSILLKFNLFLLGTNSESYDYYFDENTNRWYFNIPTSSISIKQMITQFFIKNGLCEGLITKANDINDVGGIKVNCSITKLIEAVSNEIDNNLEQGLDNHLNFLDIKYTEELIDKVYEKLFLDKFIVPLIKNKIKSMKSLDDVRIKEDLMIKSSHNYDDLYTLGNLPDIYLIPFIELAGSFMKDYNLGFANYTSYSLLEGIVRFDCFLKDLMYAYYIEKQRLLHLSKENKLVVK